MSPAPGRRYKILYQGHKSGAQSQGHLQSSLRPLATISKALIITNKLPDSKLGEDAHPVNSCSSPTNHLTPTFHQECSVLRLYKLAVNSGKLSAFYGPSGGWPTVLQILHSCSSLIFSLILSLNYSHVTTGGKVLNSADFNPKRVLWVYL